MKTIDNPLLENLSPIAVDELIEKVKRQAAEREDAIRLMLLFCDLVEKDKEIPKALLYHFKFAFESINGGLSADRALGLKKSNNRPKPDERKCIYIALDVLNYRLKGKNFNIAAELVAAEKGIQPSTVKRYWSKFKEQALGVELMRRYEEGLCLSQRETDLINKMFNRKDFEKIRFTNNTKSD